MSATGQPYSPAAPAAFATMPDRAHEPALDRWLAWLERLHPHEIDLGLERVGAVARRLGVAAPSARVVTVAGTNGKGSVCQLIAGMLMAAGWRVGLYTSPHLTRFNERVCIDGRQATDSALCQAFERVEWARGDTSLTFFEFTTLAALALFEQAGVDVLVLEVGLGGRLDATNVVDPDVAVVTSVALDHAEWLGDDLDAIAREKAGIARPGRPLIVGETAPAAGLLTAISSLGAEPWRAGVDFDYRPGAGASWHWRARGGVPMKLPVPGMGGGYQLANAATALAALAALGLPVAPEAMAAGLRAARVPGRFEVLTRVDAPAGPIEVILDVAHNPAAAATLARALGGRGPGRTLAVAAIYADKDIEGVIAAVGPRVDLWFPTRLAGPRGAPADRLAAAIGDQGGRLGAVCTDGPVAAFEAARATAGPGDRILVMGSFATVAPIRARLAPPA